MTDATPAMPDEHGMSPDHYCRACMKPTAMLAFVKDAATGRENGDLVVCLACAAPHIWTGSGVTLLDDESVAALPFEKRMQLKAAVDRTRVQMLAQRGAIRFKVNYD